MSESTARVVRTRVIRRILAVVIMLEAMICLGYGVFLGVESVIAPAADRLAAVIMAVTALALGGGLALIARAVVRGLRAVRAPIVVWQLMQLSVAYLTLGTSWLTFGIVLAVLSAAATFAAITPGVLEDQAPDS